MFNLFTFQIWENVKAKFPFVKVKKQCHPRIEVLSMQENLRVLFSGRRKYLNMMKSNF